MAPLTRKASLKGEKGVVAVKSDGKKGIKKNVTCEVHKKDEIRSTDIDGILNHSIGYPNLKIVLTRDIHSNDFQYKVQHYFSSDEEDILEEKSKQSSSGRSGKSVEEPDELQKSMKNLDISNQKGGITKSRHSLVNGESKKLESKLNKTVVNVRKSPNNQEVKHSKGNTTPSTQQKHLNATPVKQNRSTPAAALLMTNSQTPNRRSCRRTPTLKMQSSPGSERYLRERNKVNYKEELISPIPKTPTKARKEIKRESEQELTETPRKRGRQPRRGTPSRIPLASVSEERNENDPSVFCESLDEFTPRSKQRFSVRRKSTRGRKSVADANSDFIYEESPKKRRSAITTTPSTRKQTPSKRQILTPARKRATTPEKSEVKSAGRNIAATPRGRRTLTPSMHQRSVGISKPKTSLQEFRTRLHVSFVPKSLPCREAEFNNIFTFLQGKLTEEIGGCIYISGVPGTGKTATVNEVISCLKKLESQGELPNFQFIDINGMKMTEPRQAYVQIQKGLTGVTTSWEEAHRCLHQRFTTPASRRNMTLLLVDEMDLLCTKRQDVVYNLLDWPTYKSSRLVVITIANTMDLPERVLMGRVTSRLGLTRLTFQPYNHIQLMEIIKTRLRDTEVFKSEAIELAARKVASVSGDARRALDICRRATEIAENNNKEFVTISDVNSAVNEMIANPRVCVIKCCSIMERRFLEAVCFEITRTGVEQVTLKNVIKQFDTFCRVEGDEVPNITQVLEICRKLASSRLILWESGADLYQSVLLNVSADDIYFSKQKKS